MDIYTYFKSLNATQVKQLQRSNTIDEATATPAGFQALWIDFLLPDEQTSGAIVALVLLAKTQIYKNNNGPDFVEAWGLIAEEKIHSVCINQSRFYQFARAQNWEDFLKFAIVGARLITMRYKCNISAQSIIDNVIYRAASWASIAEHRYFKSYQAQIVQTFISNLAIDFGAQNTRVCGKQAGADRNF